MRIRLLSDLHAELGFDSQLLKSRGEDVLVLAGDINVGANETWALLKRFAEDQPNIVFTYGNHEFYGQEYFNTCYKLEEWAEHTGIHILNPGTVFYRDGRLSYNKADDAIAIIGAPLWTNFRNDTISMFSASRGINDFRMIETTGRYYERRRFTPDDAAALFRTQYGYIKLQYEELKCKKLIVTHFLPAVECIDPKYIGTSTLNDYFANDLGGWISTLDNTTWIHGHTHDNVDVTIGSTRIIANPYGYGKNKHYKEALYDI